MRVVVLGAGYAGLSLARRLEKALPSDVELVVVDESGDHLVQHEVHRVIRRPEVADVITAPLGDLLDRATVLRGRVDELDREARVVHLTDPDADPRETEGTGGDADGDDTAVAASVRGDPADGVRGDVLTDDPAEDELPDRLAYDYAAVCLGARTAFYGLAGLEDHATPLKSVADAEAIRDRFLEVCATGGTAVVGGAGLSGVQVAGELAALADEEGAGERVEIVVLEQLADVAPSFPPAFQRAVAESLADAGVDVRTGVTVERATAETVETDAGTVECDQLVWTGGITGSPAMDDDRPVVRSDLRLDDRTFALGDAAKVVDADGEAVPASASAAIRMAKPAATNIARLVEHDRSGGGMRPRLEPYRFDVPGWIVSVGDDAVAQVGPKVVRGTAARAMKATVGAGHLTTVGAVRKAVDLVEAELGGKRGRSRADG
jgi:NADH dehydrogenase